MGLDPDHRDLVFCSVLRSSSIYINLPASSSLFSPCPQFSSYLQRLNPLPLTSTHSHLGKLRPQRSPLNTMPPKKDPSQNTTNDDIKRLLHLDGYRKTYLAEHIRALIRMYGLEGMKSHGTTGLFYDILFIDNITTEHFRRFQAMWELRLSTLPEPKKWWDTFKAFVRDCFNKAREQMNHYYRESNAVAIPGSRWFPRPAKMQPPRPDLGTPPLVIAQSPRKRKLDLAIPTAGGTSASAGVASVAAGSTSTTSPKSAGKKPAKRQKPDHEREYSELTETSESESESLVSRSLADSESDEDAPPPPTPPPEGNRAGPSTS